MNFRLVWMGPEDDRDADGRASSLPQEAPQPVGVHYEKRGTGMVKREVLADGRVKYTPLANFSARVVSDLLCNEDTEFGRHFRIEAEIEGQHVTFEVSAEEFGRMRWVLGKLGPRAIIYPGQQQHVRAAIQCLTNQVQRERVHANLGWANSESGWVYLHVGGAICAEGFKNTVRHRLPSALNRYQLKLPGDQSELVSAVRASFGLLSLAPDRVSVPLLAAVYRAALGKVDFSVFLAGPSGSFKTTLAALCQQHFGAEMDAAHLPSNFASTANSLEELAYRAKDALLVIDDFVPTGRSSDGELHDLAERLFRAAGNHQGRSRMGGTQLRAPHPPRALILATGEQVPRGHSLRARLLILALKPGEVERVRLSECQRAAQKGQLAAAMGGFLRWVAGQYEPLQQRLRSHVEELRTCSGPSGLHARLPTTLAELRTGWEIWLQFALEAGAITTPEQAELRRRCERALSEIAPLQAQYHLASDPAPRFLSLLRAALTGNRAHVAERRGGVPEFPELWGWRKEVDGWFPQGTRIGWLVGNEIYLEPASSFQLAQQMAGAEPLSDGMQSLSRKLREHGFLASVDTARHVMPVRRILEGSSRKVLHLYKELLQLEAESARNRS